MTILIILFYLIGCVLSYGRMYGALRSIDYDYIKVFYPEDINAGYIYIITITSWLGFMIGILYYLANILEGDKEKYFIKFNKKDLIRMYYEYQLKRD